jgi:hypothetical protein
VHLVYSRVESLGADEQDPSALVIDIAAVPGLATTSVRIARDQMDGFLAILGVAKESDLVGCRVRVTVDDETRTEHLAFMTENAAISPVEPAAEGPIEAAEGAQAAEPSAEPAQPVEAVQPVEGVPEPAEPIQAALFWAQPAEDAGRGIAVMVGAVPADEITVYDGVGVVPVAAVMAEKPRDANAASVTPEELAIELRARADLAAAAAATPLEQRYFLYRETYAGGPHQSVVELTPDEFALLGGTGSYLHVGEGTIVAAQDLPPDAAQGIERLLERATSRPEAGLPRADVERLALEGHVVSLAVY